MEVFKETALGIPKKDLQNEQLQKEPNERKRKLEEQVQQLETYCTKKRKDSEAARSELTDLRTSFSTSEAANESFRNQLEGVTKLRDDHAEHLFGLMSNTISGLQASEQLLKKRVEGLTADVAQLRQHADRSAADAHKWHILHDAALEDCATLDGSTTRLNEVNLRLQEQLSISLERSNKVNQQKAAERQRITECEEEFRTQEADIQQLKASESTASIEH